MNTLGSWIAKGWEKPRPFTVLVRHFFLRLFQNDFVAFEDQMKEKTVSILAIMSILSAHVANSVLMKYMFAADEGMSWVEKSFFASFIMFLLGFITVFEWDVLFPDSRDFANLMVLPVRLRTIFSAKFTSLCCFVGLFAFGVNALAVFPFWFHLPKWQAEGNILFSTYFVFVHLLCMFAASFFIFFFAAFLIGVLMVILPLRFFRSISLLMRTLLIISFVFALTYIVSASMTASQPMLFLFRLKLDHSPLFYVFPPVWFTGLYETLLGNADPQFRTCSLMAITSLFFVTFGFFLTSALSYWKFFRKTVTRRKPGQKIFLFKTSLLRIFDAVFLRNPIQRGVFYFFGKTFRESMVHKMNLATFAAVGFALSLILLAVQSGTPDSFSEPNRTLLSIPLIWTFFLLVGVRNIVNIPFRLEANWIFKLTEEEDLRHYAAGLRKGITFVFLLPLAVVVIVFSSFLWRIGMGFINGICGFALSVFLMEILFLKYSKIPFSCAYLPGQVKAHLLWPAYIVSFLAYVSLSGVIEWILQNNVLYSVYFLCPVLLAMVILRAYQIRRLFSKKSLIFEEEPEPVLVTLLTYSQK